MVPWGKIYLKTLQLNPNTYWYPQMQPQSCPKQAGDTHLKEISGRQTPSQMTMNNSFSMGLKFPYQGETMCRVWLVNNSFRHIKVMEKGTVIWSLHTQTTQIFSSNMEVRKQFCSYVNMQEIQVHHPIVGALQLVGSC